MSARARMAYVRSFIGKGKGKHGGSLKDQMDYVRSFRGKKGKKSGGKFPKGTLSQWKAKANSGSAKDRAKYQRAIANWNKLMSNSSFKEKWNSNKIRKGGALEDGVNYRDLISMYQNRTFGMGYPSGGAVRGYGVRGGAVRGYGMKGGAVRGYGLNGGAVRGYGLPPNLLGVKGRKYAGVKGGAVRGYGYTAGQGIFSPKLSKKFQQIYLKHLKRGAGVTKRDLYRGAGKQNSAFFTRNRILQKQRKKPMTISPPTDEMVQLYRDLYKDSGIHPENMIDPVVRNDRLKGGKFFKKVGKVLSAPVRVARKYNVVSSAAKYIPGPAGKAVRMGARALGAGLIEEAGLNGRGHPPYIYH